MLSSVTQKFGDASRWIGRQVVGQDDFGRPQDQRTRDYAILGATAGAVTGAAIGVSTGFSSQAGNSIDEVWVERNIVHPEMRGYRHTAVPDFNEVCTSRNSEGSCTSSYTEIRGWWHQYSPNIHNRVVGNFNEPTFRNTNSWEPLKGGVFGALGGGLVGLALGVGAAALHRTLDGDRVPSEVKLNPETEKALVTRTGAAVIAGTAVGAGVGIYLGNQAGQAELASQQVHTRTWNIPVTQRETIGHIPPSHYEYNWTGFPLPLGGNRAATQAVNRDVPTYNSGGQPRLTGTQKTFETNRYGPIFGGLAGGMIGAGVGLAAGVAFGITDKMLTERKAAKEAQVPPSGSSPQTRTSGTQAPSGIQAPSEVSDPPKIQPHLVKV